MTPKQSAKAAFERRFKAKGGHNLCVRLPANVMAHLEALAEADGTSRRDVIERLILSRPLDALHVAMREHGLSEPEAREFCRG